MTDQLPEPILTPEDQAYFDTFLKRAILADLMRIKEETKIPPEYFRGTRWHFEELLGRPVDDWELYFKLSGVAQRWSYE